MAQIELRQRFFGEGVVGEVDLPGAAAIVDPLKQAFVDAAERTAVAVQGVRQDLVALGWSVGQVADAVWSLERQLSWRLQEQTAYLQQQVAALQSIDAALRSPAKVRAAERMSDAAGLLRTGRHERALRCAQEAIEGDPNHPGGFAAAGWASLGLDHSQRAADYFLEARSASTGTERANYTRQAARCLLVGGDIEQARLVLEDELGLVADDTIGGMLHYDAALACALLDDAEAGAAHVVAAVDGDVRFAQMAVAEPLFESHPKIATAAVRRARELHEAAEAQQRLLRETLPALRARVSRASKRVDVSIPQWMTVDDQRQFMALLESARVLLQRIPSEPTADDLDHALEQLAAAEVRVEMMRAFRIEKREEFEPAQGAQPRKRRWFRR